MNWHTLYLKRFAAVLVSVLPGFTGIIGLTLGALWLGEALGLSLGFSAGLAALCIILSFVGGVLVGARIQDAMLPKEPFGD